MNVLPALLLLAVAALAMPPAATARVNRCTASDGTAVFTDQDCHLMGTAYRLADAYDARPAVRRPGAMQGTGGVSRFGVGCAARSPEGLRSAVRAAVDSGDANQLAGLYDWNGAGRGHAMDVMRRMQRLVARASLAVELDADAGPYDAPALPGETALTGVAGPPSIHVLRAHGAPGPNDAVRFEIVRDAGCLWLRF